MTLARAATLLIGVLVSGCYSTNTVSLSDARSELHRGKQVELVLADGTRASFSRGMVSDFAISGHVESCAGDSCAEIRRDMTVPLARVTEFRGRVLSKPLTTVAAVVAVAGTAILVYGAIALSRMKWSSGSWR